MGGYYYTTKAGDMWDYIAWAVYGEERFVEELLRAEENRELIHTWIFSAGVQVWCPYIEETEEDNDTPEWRSEG
jgi:phage tail protein X